MQVGIRVALAAAALVASLGACTAMDQTIHQVDASGNEKLLKMAGFTAVAADTPQKIESLNTFAPNAFTRVGVEGQARYVYTDPYQCRCFWMGGEQQYERYRRLEAEEMLPAVELTGVEAGPDWFEGDQAW